MDLKRIKSLIDAMSASDLAEIEFSEGGWSLRLTRTHSAATKASEPAPNQTSGKASSDREPARPQPATSEISADEITSPMFGTVYLSPAPGRDDFVQPGQAVTTGAILCVVEAMKVFNEVRATHDGIISDILVTAGDEVEAGQPLMRFQ